jgi:hypothetical protein
MWNECQGIQNSLSHNRDCHQLTFLATLIEHLFEDYQYSKHYYARWDRQNAFLEQFEVSDDEESGTSNSTLEAGHSSGDPSTEFSSAEVKSEKALVEPIEVHECAFCRSEVSSFLNQQDSVRNALFAMMFKSHLGWVLLQLYSAW